MSCWSGSRVLVHHQYCTLTETSFGYPAVVPSHGDHATMVPQDQSLHILQQVIDGVDVGICQLKVLDSGLDSS